MQKLRNFSKKIKAFTITELVIVIAVIAILASVLIPTFTGVIEKANVSADIQELHSVNVQLALQEEPITDEEGLKSVINSVFGETFYDSMSPRSEKYGYHYWYDVKNNKIVLGTYDEILAGTSASVSDNVVYADNASEIIAENPVGEIAISSQNKFLPNSFRSIISGYYLLDRVGAMASAIDAVEALTALTEENETTGGAYFSVINALTSTKAGSKDLNFATAILNKLSTTAIVTEAGTFRFQNVKEVTSLVFAKNITKISSSVYVYNGESVVKEYLSETNFIANVSNIALPSTVQKVASGALYFGGETAHTSALLITDLEEGDLSSVFSVSSTNATILAKKQGQNAPSTEYVLIGKNVVEKESGNVVGGVEYSNKVTHFDIITPNSVAGKLATVGTTLYIAYDHANSFVLTTDNFNVDASSTKINWSVSANDFLTVNENGEVSITALPAVNACTATITATPEAGGIEKTLTVYVVRPNVSSLTLAGNPLSMVNNAITGAEIVYFGTEKEYAFTFAITNNAPVEANVACESELTIETEENNCFEIVSNGETITLVLKDNFEILQAGQVITIKHVGINGIVYAQKDFTITVNDQSSKPFEAKFASAGEYLHRVGNATPLKLSSLFATAKAPNENTLTIYDMVTYSDGLADEIAESGATDGSVFWAEYNKQIASDGWENQMIKFYGTGVVKIQLNGVFVVVEVVSGTVTAEQGAVIEEGVVLPTSPLAPTFSVKIKEGARPIANEGYYYYNEETKTIHVGITEGGSYTVENIVESFTATKYSGVELTLNVSFDAGNANEVTFSAVNNYTLVLTAVDNTFFTGEGMLYNKNIDYVVAEIPVEVVYASTKYEVEEEVAEIASANLYQVKTGTDIALNSLFVNQKAPTQTTVTVEDITNIAGSNFSATYSATISDFTTESINFTGTGVAKITLQAQGSSLSTVLFVEVVTQPTNDGALFLPTLTENINAGTKPTEGNNEEYYYSEKGSIFVGINEGAEYTANVFSGEATATKYSGQVITVNAKVSEGLSFDSENGTITFDEEGTYTITLTYTDELIYDNNGILKGKSEVYTKKVTVTVVYVSELYELKFENTDKYLYRVGNANEVKLGSLFTNNLAPASSTLKIYDVSGADAEGEYDIAESGATDGSEFWAKYEKQVSGINNEWEDYTIKFHGTGVARIVINELELCVEVVNGTNVTTYSELKNQNSVLLNNITMSSGGAYTLSNATLYGNGFTFDVKNGAYTAVNYLSDSYVISLNDSILDNIKIEGAVYSEFNIYPKYNYNRATVYVTGNSTITNSYISNCMAPIRVNCDSLEIINTTLKGGAYANMDIRGGNIVLEDVTTINQTNTNESIDGKTPAGLGLVVYYETVPDDTSIKIKGNLTQYNAMSKTQAKNIGVAEITALTDIVYGSAYKDIQYVDENGETWINMGILCGAQNLTSASIVLPEGGIKLDGQEYQNKNFDAYGKTGFACISKPTANTLTMMPSKWDSTAQGAIAPSYEFDYINKNYVAKTDGSNDYCYYSNGTVLISMDQDDTFNWDTSILTATKNGKTLNYTVAMNGTDYTGKSITFNESGDYTVSYTYVDSDNYYISNGEYQQYDVTYTKTVKISISVVQAAAKNAEFTFGSSNTTSKTVTIGNDTYVMPDVTATSNTIGSTTVNGTTIYCPIVEAYTSDGKYEHSSLNSWYMCFPVFKGAVTITDYADNGTGAAVIYNSSTTTLPTGLSVYDPGTTFLYQSSGAAPTEPAVLNNVLIYKSPTLSNNARVELYVTAKYTYKDNAGAIYSYYIQYHCKETTVSSGGCVTPDTLVTLADGTKKEIQNVTYEDKLLVWDFYKGEYTTVTSAIIFNHGYDNNTVIKLNFSDGTQVKVVNLHQFFNADLNQFVTIDDGNVANYVGQRFVKQNGEGYTTVTLTSYEISEEYIQAYGIISALHYNILVEDMFSTDFMPNDYALFNYFEVGKNMKFNEVKMQADIEQYGLYTYADFADYLTYEQFVGFNVQYFKIAVGKGVYTYEGILDLIQEYLKG